MEKNFIKIIYLKGKIIFTRGVQFLYSLAKPRSQNEDLKRREFILNTLILGTIGLSSVMLLIIICDSIKTNFANKGQGFSISFLSFILISFFILYSLSRRGHFILASYIFLAAYLLPVIYMSYLWGISVPQGLLMYSLIIIMAGILINTQCSLVLAVFISLALFVLGYLQTHGVIVPNLYWKKKPIDTYDAIAHIATFGIISIVSWLSSREIEKSLNRARSSESDLKQERDSLEIKVEERTRELKKAQMERMMQLYRFAEFGQLSSGLFHDLVNPLTALSLNLSQVKNESGREDNKSKMYLIQALAAAKKMEDFIVAVKKQIQKQEIEKNFSLNEEISQVIQIFLYKACKSGVELVFSSAEEVKTYGNPIKFSQAVSNLVSNAIDSYEKLNRSKDKCKIFINLERKDDIISLSVEDFGCGISKEYFERIFDPFFTTKGAEKGTGIGLSSTKSIFEKNFGGSIIVQSEKNKGTKFIISFPIREIK